MVMIVTMIVAEYFGCVLSGGERGYMLATEGCGIGAKSCQDFDWRCRVVIVRFGARGGS